MFHNSNLQKRLENNSASDVIGKTLKPVLIFVSLYNGCNDHKSRDATSHFDILNVEYYRYNVSKVYCNIYLIVLLQQIIKLGSISI